jgi:hypothetical protein
MKLIKRIINWFKRLFFVLTMRSRLNKSTNRRYGFKVMMGLDYYGWNRIIKAEAKRERRRMRNLERGGIYPHMPSWREHMAKRARKNPLTRTAAHS